MTGWEYMLARSGWENVVEYNGVMVAIAGVAIVFAALSVIATFIWLLPSAMAMLARVAPEQEERHVAPQPSPAGDASQDASIAAAIGYAMYLESQKTK